MNDSAMRALNKYSQKQIKSTKKSKSKKRTGLSPEKTVEKEVMKWIKDQGFSCNVVEAKAIYSPTAGQYLRGQTDAGFPDIAGCTPHGLGCFIELKAKGKRSTLKEHQRQFLIEKINRGAFAVCVDSVDCLRDIINRIKGSSYDQRKDLLLDHLPKKRKPREEEPSFLD